jgi:GTPase
VLAEDKLFATLDPTTRRVKLPGGRDVLFTDTVGFINKLPTFLIAAFRATLEEINAASLLVHVVDARDGTREHSSTVENVLEELGADDKPVITVLNKADLVDVYDAQARSDFARSLDLPADFIPISGLTGDGLEALLARIEQELEDLEDFLTVTGTFPYDRSELVDLFHRLGRVEGVSYDERGATVAGVLPSRSMDRFSPYLAIAGSTPARQSAARSAEIASSDSAA